MAGGWCGGFGFTGDVCQIFGRGGFRHSNFETRRTKAIEPPGPRQQRHENQTMDEKVGAQVARGLYGRPFEPPLFTMLSPWLKYVRCEEVGRSILDWILFNIMLNSANCFGVSAKVYRCTKSQLGNTILVKLKLWELVIVFNKTFWSATNSCLRYALAKCGR